MQIQKRHHTLERLQNITRTLLCLGTDLPLSSEIAPDDGDGIGLATAYTVQQDEERLPADLTLFRSNSGS
jgi:hypothetical protein